MTAHEAAIEAERLRLERLAALDAELEAERVVIEIMGRLSPAARGRVLGSLERFHRQAAERERAK